MNPKTYQIRLRQPFGWMTQEPYFFYLHVANAQEAFAWVARVFEGIDLRQTPASLRPRVGNPDTVSVTDCDLYRNRTRIQGRFRTVETPEGHFRKSEAEVVSNLHKVFKNIQSERKRFVESFAWMKTCYERDGVEWVYDRVVLIQKMHALAERWEANVWQEYVKIAPKDELVLPEKRLPPILKHIVMTARERAASVI